jgi:hypothetical protein
VTVGSGSSGCTAGSLGCALLENMSLPETGTYRITIVPPGMQTMTFALTIAKNLATTISSGAAQTLNLSPQLGIAARFSFTVASGQNHVATLSGVSTVPANVSIWMGIYTPSGSYVTGNQTTTGETLNINGLAPGNYYLWIGVLSMINSATMQFAFQ